MNHLLRHTTIFLALLTLLLTACGRSAPTHLYLLDSGQPPLTADSLPAASLSIAPVSVPDYLDRNGLVRRSDGQTRLEVSELTSGPSRWDRAPGACWAKCWPPACCPGAST